MSGVGLGPQPTGQASFLSLCERNPYIGVLSSPLYRRQNKVFLLLEVKLQYRWNAWKRFGFCFGQFLTRTGRGDNKYEYR
jgi:hypothetical protein